MITLLTFAPSFGQPASSPFCVKAMMLLNMAGAEWTSEIYADPRKMPYGKLPAIRVNGEVIADSDNIRAWLEVQGADFNQGLTKAEIAYSRALIRMAEEHLYFHVMHDRWGDDAVWPTIRDAYFGMIPRPIRGVVTRQIRKPVLASLKQMGIGRFTPEERLARAEPDLKAIADLLTGPFLFGDKLTAADVCVAPQLAGMMATPVPTLLGDRVRGDRVLAAYVARVSEVALTDSSRKS